MRPKFVHIKKQWCLRQNRITHGIALLLQAGLDAGGEIVARENLVDASQPPLQRHGIVPFAGAAEIVKRDANEQRQHQRNHADQNLPRPFRSLTRPHRFDMICQKYLQITEFFPRDSVHSSEENEP